MRRRARTRVRVAASTPTLTLALALFVAPWGGISARQIAAAENPAAASAEPAAPLQFCAFAEQGLHDRCRRLLRELRCPQCPNQNLEDSPGPLSQDLRRHLHEMLAAGHSDREILAYMTERYGSFIRYLPPWNRETSLLWLAPVGFALLAAACAWGVLRRNRWEAS